MKTYIYSYEDQTGKFAKGKLKAQNVGQAKNFLKSRKIIPLSIKEDKENFLKALFTEKSVQPDDIVAFTQLFSSCIQTGMTVKESLTLLSKQVESKILRSRIDDVISDVEGGQPMSTAFFKHTDIFPEFYPMLLKAGEASGDLPGILDYLGNYLERINSLRKELTGIFTYPIIVSAIGIALLSLILIYVAPTFRDVFSQVGTPLPFPTVILFFMSDLISSYYPFLLGLAGLAGIGFFFLNRSYNGKKALHKLIMTAPFIGKVIREAILLRFLKAFEILVNNSVPILEALKVLEDGSTNLVLREIIKEMRKDVSKGLPMAGPLLASRDIISPLISYSVSMGEKSGNLGITLQRLSNLLDREISFSMKKLSSKLDPLLTMGLGSMVLFIALAIYLPIFDMMSNPG